MRHYSKTAWNSGAINGDLEVDVYSAGAVSGSLLGDSLWAKIGGFQYGGVPIEFVWNEVPDAIKYELEVNELTAADTFLVVINTEGTDTIFDAAGHPFEESALHYWRVRAENDCGWGVFSDYFVFGLLTDVKEIPREQLPAHYELAQNYPNPFNPKTQIFFSLPKSGEVKLAVYNTLGQKIVTLVDGNVAAGVHAAEFESGDFVAGVHSYRLEVNEFTETGKMMLMK